ERDYAGLGRVLLRAVEAPVVPGTLGIAVLGVLGRDRGESVLRALGDRRRDHVGRIGSLRRHVGVEADRAEARGIRGRVGITAPALRQWRSFRALVGS